VRLLRSLQGEIETTKSIDISSEKLQKLSLTSKASAFPALFSEAFLKKKKDLSVSKT
jgi:hypothetical protein